MLKLALASDLHLEFGDINLTNDENADVLILSGDILIIKDLYDYPEIPEQDEITSTFTFMRRKDMAKRFRDFLRRCSNNFPEVVYVAGNHEFYHGKWHASLDYINDECLKFSNIHFLENQTWEYKDHVFIGATLWTDMNKGDPITLYTTGMEMNDYQTIRVDIEGYRKLKPNDTVNRHVQTKKFIQNTIKNFPDRKYIVVGHHAPCKLSINQKYVNEHHINGAYVSDLSEFILDHPQIKLWTHGHTHYPFDYMLGDTRIVCNPRGYEGYEFQASTFKLQYIDVS